MQLSTFSHLFLKAIVFYLIIEFKDNQRVKLISKFIIPISLIINIFSFTTHKKIQTDKPIWIEYF